MAAVRAAAEALPECAIDGLAELLAGCKLLEKLEAAVAWCEAKGVDSMEELKEVEMEKELVTALDLKEAKAKLVLKRLGAA